MILQAQDATLPLGVSAELRRAAAMPVEQAMRIKRIDEITDRLVADGICRPRTENAWAED
jgi:hypothetical protein